MTSQWNEKSLNECVANYCDLSLAQQKELAESLSQNFSPDIYILHNQRRLQALNNQAQSQNILMAADQTYPATLDAAKLQASATDLAGFAIVLTAGGEGERLRVSLAELGYSDEQLHNFTKATFPLPGLPLDFGALQANLCLIAKISKESGLNIPVVITTGPKNSTTAEYIPQILAQYHNFGVKNLRVICQAERLHLNNEGKIVADTTVSPVTALTNPDETGGPLMQLREKLTDGMSCLEWFEEHDCSKILVLQATALYNPALLFAMAVAGKNYDGLGIGIARSTFLTADPYGTFVQINRDGEEQLIIVEKDIRNQSTYQLQHQENGNYLPFNTGFYVFDCALLKHGQLPDYATPPKEQLLGLPKSAKIGYAATDILSLAQQPAVLTVPAEWFAVIKNAEDLHVLAELAVKCGIDHLINEQMNQNP